MLGYDGTPVHLPQVRFEVNEATLAVSMCSRVAKMREEENNVQDTQYNARCSAVTAVLPPACADLQKPALL